MAKKLSVFKKIRIFHISKGSTIRARFYVLLFLALGLSFVLFIIRDRLRPEEESLYPYGKPVYPPPVTIPLAPKPTPPPLPDFTRESVKSRTQFDLASWREFTDDRVGLRFRFPPDWGNPEIFYNTSKSCSIKTPLSICPQTGELFWVGFPNSDFKVGGTSNDFTLGRGGLYTDFNGFKDAGSLNQYWPTPEALCQDQAELFCLIEGNTVHLLSSLRCPGERVIGSFYRLYYVDRPGKTISGLVFGGYFFSEAINTGSLLNACKLTGGASGVVDPVAKKLLDQAVLGRKLDAQSMRNFDAFEKVFETVATY